jgi:hypothetical protein
MTGALLLAFLMAPIVWTYAIATLIFSSSTRSELQSLLRAERNRNRFGELRTELMDHVRTERVSVNSEHFRVLYRFLTLLMREPRQYDSVVSSILLSEFSTKRVAGEAVEVEREMYRKVAHAFHLLCLDYNFIYRMYAWLVQATSRLVVGAAGLDDAPFWIFWMKANSVRAMKAKHARDGRKVLEHAAHAHPA